MEFVQVLNLNIWEVPNVLNLKKERLNRSLTQQELAVKVGMSYADISRIENGRLIPYPGHIKRLSNFFEISEDELLKEV